MALELDEAVFYLDSDKELAAGAGWQPKKNRAGSYPVMFFERRLRIAQAMPRGLKFRISVFPTFPDVATFQLECDQPGQKTCLVLYRLEWHPISGHSNGLGLPTPPEIQGLVFLPGDTHEHTCRDHVTAVERRVLEPGVHAARRIEPDFQTYDAALSYVCGRIRLINPEAIPPSGAQWDLGV
ncbi:hypothetical protein AXW83_01060 [Bosea sp. PAMC 26642]|nr:hypothetical protein AXW83_01060 [Bosea sp. PAMC 26642]